MNHNKCDWALIFTTCESRPALLGKMSDLNYL